MMGIVDFELAVQDMARGNPGATEVLSNVFRVRGEDEFSSVVHGLRMMKLYGPQIYLCYKDFACEDLGRFIEAVRNRDQDMQDLVHRRGR